MFPVASDVTSNSIVAISPSGIIAFTLVGSKKSAGIIPSLKTPDFSMLFINFLVVIAGFIFVLLDWRTRWY
jgi:hypothetical protein